MSGKTIGFGEEIKKLCQKMYAVRMLIWSAAIYIHMYTIANSEELDTTTPTGIYTMNYIL